MYVRHWIVAALISLSFAAHVQAQDTQPSTPQTLRLRTGEVVTGRIEAVHVGVDVRVRRPDGTVRVLRWVELDTPVSPSYPNGVHVGVSVGPSNPPPQSVPLPTTDDRLHPAPGRIALAVETPNRSVTLGGPMQGMVVSVRGRAEQVFRSLCDTPCTLYVQPDQVAIYTRPTDSASTFTLAWRGLVPWPTARLQLWNPNDLALAPTMTDPIAANAQQSIRDELAETQRIHEQHDRLVAQRESENSRVAAQRDREFERTMTMYRTRQRVGWPMFFAGLAQVGAGVLVGTAGAGSFCSRCDTTPFIAGGITIGITGAVASGLGVVAAITGLDGQIHTGVSRFLPAPEAPPEIDPASMPQIPEWVPILTP